MQIMLNLSRIIERRNPPQPTRYYLYLEHEDEGHGWPIEVPEASAKRILETWDFKARPALACPDIIHEIIRKP
jgi:hypothetical protein